VEEARIKTSHEPSVVPRSDNCFSREEVDFLVKEAVGNCHSELHSRISERLDSEKNLAVEIEGLKAKLAESDAARNIAVDEMKSNKSEALALLNMFDEKNRELEAVTLRLTQMDKRLADSQEKALAGLKEAQAETEAMRIECQKKLDAAREAKDSAVEKAKEKVVSTANAQFARAKEAYTNTKKQLESVKAELEVEKARSQDLEISLEATRQNQIIDKAGFDRRLSTLTSELNDLKAELASVTKEKDELIVLCDDALRESTAAVSAKDEAMRCKENAVQERLDAMKSLQNATVELAMRQADIDNLNGKLSTMEANFNDAMAIAESLQNSQGK